VSRVGFFVLATLFIALALAPAPPVTAAAPIDFYLTASVQDVDPGDNVTFRAILDNAGPGTAQRVWINITLDDNVTYVGDNAPTALGGVFQSRTFALPTIRYIIDSYAPGNRTMEVWTRVEAPVLDQERILTVCSLEYLDDVGAKPATQWTQAVPIVQVASLALGLRGPTQVSPSSSFDYVLWYNNTGSYQASTVDLRVALPPEVAFVSVTGGDAGGCVPDGRWVNCTVALVGQIIPFGPKSLRIAVSVGVVPFGTSLLALADASYAADDDGDYALTARATLTSNVSGDTRLVVAVVPDAAIVPPGGVVHVHFELRSIGTVLPPRAWFNATLPPDTTVVTATPPPTSATASVVRWDVASPAAVSEFALELHVADTLSNGTVLLVGAAADYTDVLGRRMPAADGNAAVLVLTGLPDLVLSFTSSRTTVPTGGTAAVTAEIRNEGAGRAESVTLNVELPDDILLDSSTPAATLVSGRYRFDLGALPPGTTVVTLTLRLSASAVTGASLQVNGSLTYTDVEARPLPAVTEGLALTAGPPESDPILILAIGAGIAIAVLIVIGALVVNFLRRGKPDYAEVFLLHKDGILLGHFEKTSATEIDSDVLSGMLIAVQNFINESFIGKDWETSPKEGLDELKFGQYRISLVRGETTVIAAVVSGPRPEEAHRQLRLVLEDIEKEFGTVLATWNGDMDAVKGAHRYVEELLAGKYARRR